MEGTPDILGSYEGVSSVIDFKTAAYRYDKSKTYLGEQMYLYAHLAKSVDYEAKQVVYIVFVKGKEPGIQVIQREISQEHLKKVLDNIVNQCKTLDMVEEKGLWTHNTNSCFMGSYKCDFYNKCWGGYDNE